MYRSGLLVRQLPDRALIFEGPAQDHVNFYGYRLWPADIESCLAQCPGVREVAVAFRDDGRSAQRLVAYVVRDGAPPTLRALRRFLTTDLPSCPWPARLVVVPSLPRTPEGQVDRSVLPNPPEGPLVEESSGGQTRDEGLLAEAACEVLGVAEVAPDASYWGSFAFLAAVAKARAKGARITSAQIRENRTFAMLGAAMAAAEDLGPPAVRT